MSVVGGVTTSRGAWTGRAPGGLPLGRVGFFSVRAGVLHIGEERPHEPIPGFPRDSGIFLERRFSADGFPCAEGPALHMGGFQQR